MQLTFTIDNIVFPIGGLLCLAGQVGHVRTGIRFGNAQADPLLSLNDSRNNPVLEFLLSELHDWRQTDGVTTNHVPYKPTGTSARDFVCYNKLVEKIPFLCWDGGDPVWGVFYRVVETKKTAT